MRKFGLIFLLLMCYNNIFCKHPKLYNLCELNLNQKAKLSFNTPDSVLGLVYQNDTTYSVDLPIGEINLLINHFTQSNNLTTLLKYKNIFINLNNEIQKIDNLKDSNTLNTVINMNFIQTNDRYYILFSYGIKSYNTVQPYHTYSPYLITITNDKLYKIEHLKGNFVELNCVLFKNNKSNVIILTYDLVNKLIFYNYTSTVYMKTLTLKYSSLLYNNSQIYMGKKDFLRISQKLSN